MALLAGYVEWRPKNPPILSGRSTDVRIDSLVRHQARPQGARLLLSGKSDLLRRGAGNHGRHSRHRLRRGVPGALEPAFARRPSVRVQGYERKYGPMRGRLPRRDRSEEGRVGKSVSVRVDIGGRGHLKTKIT